MFLEAIRCEPLSVPLVDPFVISSGRVEVTRSVLVTVVMRDGERRVEGLGEGSCLPPVTREDQPDALAAVTRIQSKLIGQGIDQLAEIDPLLDSLLGEFPVARCAVEMAILDALAQLRGLPLFALLSGGKVSAIAPIVTDITLPILPPARMAELAGEWWAQGFRSFKVKVGAAVEDDLRALEAIMNAVPEARIRIDANGGYDAATALAFLRELQRRGVPIECFEEPCPRERIEEMARVAAATDVPVIADESVKSLADLERVQASSAADGVNLKIAKSGGILRALEIGRSAREAGMSLMVGGMVETRLGMTAATHLVAALGGVEFPDLDTAWLLKSDPFRGGYRAFGPSYTLGDETGLGISRRR